MCRGRWGRWDIEGVKGGLQQWRSTPISVPLKSSHGLEKVERRRGIRNDTNEEVESKVKFGEG